MASMGKRAREAEDDEVYLDNFHNNKRYLTEVISTSMNSLRVHSEDASREGPMEIIKESPSRSETPALSRSLCSPYHRGNGDEVCSSSDSPMSDDSEESVGYRCAKVSETSQRLSSLYPGSPPENTSPSRQLLRTFSMPHTSSAGRQQLPRQRSHEMESRLPPSPSDTFQPGDLRRAALMRALQRSNDKLLDTKGLYVVEQPEKSPLSQSYREDHGVDNTIPLHDCCSERAVPRSLILDVDEPVKQDEAAECEVSGLDPRVYDVPDTTSSM